MLKIGEIYEIAIYEQWPRTLAAMFFDEIKFFEGIWKTVHWQTFLWKKNWNPITGLGEEDFLRIGTWLSWQQGE